VKLLHDRSLAAVVGLVVVDLISAAGRVPAVGTIFHRTIAAERSPVVVDRRTTTTSVRVVGRGSDDTTATLLGHVVVCGIAAASGAATGVSSSQLARAADVVVMVEDLIARPTAAVAGEIVDLRSAATGIRAVSLVEENAVGTTNMGVSVVQQTSAAARVDGHSRLDASAAHAESPVVHDSVAACRV